MLHAIAFSSEAHRYWCNLIPPSLFRVPLCMVDVRTVAKSGVRGVPGEGEGTVRYSRGLQARVLPQVYQSVAR